jgi:glycosyltransferase involved in cell wall biosynthesis
MKKVLIITHGFPGTGGRGNIKIIKYLARFGYEPIVLTNRSQKDVFEDKVIAEELGNKIRIYKTRCLNKSPFRIFSKFFNSWDTTVYFEKLFFIPDLYITWVPSALLKGLQLIKHEPIDAIITASPPESIHITGLLLSKLTGVKWIPDFRDLWTTKNITNKSATKLHDIIIKKIEKLIYREMDHIIANTNGNKDIYMNHFHIPEEKITVITNGYDPEELIANNNQSDRNQKEIFTIGYMGYFDKPGFPWEKFILAIQKMYTSNNAKVQVNICGHVSRQAKDYIAEKGLSKIVRCHGTHTHTDAAKLIGGNDVLLLLLYETDYSKAIVPHKLYHYLGMAKPIIAIAEEDGEVANIINTTRTGKIVSASRTDAIYNMIIDYYTEWKNSGCIKYNPDKEQIEKYDVIQLTEKLSRTITLVAQDSSKEVRDLQAF